MPSLTLTRLIAHAACTRGAFLSLLRSTAAVLEGWRANYAKGKKR